MAPLQRSKSSTKSDQLQIQHFIHQHVLHKLYMTSEFNCDGCNTGGYGVRYRCSPCDFDLHEQCATAPHRISTSLHPHHHLVLVNRPGDTHFCHVCKGVTNGLSYACEVQLCEFNVHGVCVQIPVEKNGEKSLSLDPCQVPGAVATMVVSNNNNNNKVLPVVVDQHRQQQMQGVPMTVVGGYNGGSNGQHVMVNHHQQQQMQGIHTMQFGGHNGATTSQAVMINNNQAHMINHHQQQQMKPMVGYGGNYHGVNNSQPMMVNQHLHQQQQRIPTTTFGGYGMNSQPVMVNHHHHQQQQMMPMTTAFNPNQQFITNNHHQVQQQGVGIPPTAVGGYNVVNNNQTVMISHPPPPPPPPPQRSNGVANVGRLAANILSTSLIGMPIFMSGK